MGKVVVSKPMSISHWLREMLKEYESSYEMALALGVREPTLNRWLNGKRTPSASSCIKLAEATDTPVEDVMRMAYGDGDRPGR